MRHGQLWDTSNEASVVARWDSGRCTKATVNGDGEKGSKEAYLTTVRITREKQEVRGPYSEATAIVLMGHGSETQEAPREVSM